MGIEDIIQERSPEPTQQSQPRQSTEQTQQASTADGGGIVLKLPEPPDIPANFGISTEEFIVLLLIMDTALLAAIAYQVLYGGA
jgi:hypothetical protein